ncbi:hypothetical protein MB901379_02634 [Mycobacterium basiliense]|uniref:Uncharacterized protein n=1 Tax=Mycobacterium basiliense TaxID=2094119 RepID=A0A3S4CCA8_9MYCO|nr:hypothetical protein MB901379_02634 [Mycobacterium basiliense]
MEMLPLAIAVDTAERSVLEAPPRAVERHLGYTIRYSADAFGSASASATKSIRSADTGRWPDRRTSPR